MLTASEWIPALSAVGAIAAAVVAGVFASRARRAEAREQRVLELERRLASHKAEVYEPMLEFFRKLFDASVAGGGGSPPIAEEEMIETISRFATWIQIYGSDEAVRAFNRFMQAAYTEPPPQILMRLYGGLVLAARKDLGPSHTDIGIIELLGIRLKDAYSPEFRDVFSVNEDELFGRYDWSPPWRA
jgi:hypothetical protein